MFSFTDRHNATVAAMVARFAPLDMEKELTRQVAAKEKELAAATVRLARINAATFYLTYGAAPARHATGSN